MAKEKLKTQQNARKKAQVIQRGIKNELGRGTPGLNVWTEEITALKGHRFTGIDEAVRAIAGGVAAKMSKGDEVDPAEVEFLITFIKSDPQMLEELKRALSLK